MKVRISLLPETYKPEKQFRIGNVLLPIGFIIVGVIIAFLEISIRAQINQNQIELTNVNKQLQLFDKEVKQTRELRKQLERINKYLSVKSEISKGTWDVPEVLDSMRKIVPVDVWITKFDIDKNGKISMDFSTYSLNAAANTIIMFNQSKNFEKEATTISKINQEDKNSTGQSDKAIISFSLTTQFKRGETVGTTNK